MSGEDASLIIDTLLIEGIKGKSNIYCAALQSCDEAEMANGDSVYCLGYGSCWSSDTYVHDFINFYVYGSRSFYGTANNIENNVYCVAYRACEDFQMTNVGNNVIGAGYHALFEAQISNVSNGVIAIGYQVARATDIVNTGKYVLGIGLESLINTDIVNVGEYVIGIGDNSLKNTTIRNTKTVCQTLKFSVLILVCVFESSQCTQRKIQIESKIH